MLNPFKIVAIVGVILISVGIIKRKRRTEDIYYILGGLCMFVYSIHVEDLIFIVLQIIFTGTAMYDFYKTIMKKK